MKTDRKTKADTEQNGLCLGRDQKAPFQEAVTLSRAQPLQMLLVPDRPAARDALGCPVTKQTRNLLAWL